MKNKKQNKQTKNPQMIKLLHEVKKKEGNLFPQILFLVLLGFEG